MRTVLASFVCVAALTVGASSASAQTAQMLDTLPDLRQYSVGIAKMLETAPPAQVAPGPFQTGLAVPASDAPPQIRRWVKDAMKSARKDPEVVQLLNQVPPDKVDALYAQAGAELEAEILQGLNRSEARLDELGLARRDMGAALGLALVDAYEAANRLSLPTATAQKAAQSLAMATTKYFKPKYDSKTTTEKADCYVVLLGAMSRVSVRADLYSEQDDTEGAARMREFAAKVFEKLAGTPPSRVTILPDGRIVGLASRPLRAKPNPKS